MKFSLATLLLIALLPLAAPAATVVVTQEASGRTLVMTVDGVHAHLQSDPRNYILADLARGAFYAVDLEDGFALDLSTASQPPAGQSAPTATLLDRGPGPAVAGFETRRYQIVAAGRVCSETLLSRPAMERAGLEPFLKGFREFYLRQRAAYRQHAAPANPCDDAQDAAWRRYPSLGLPLRSMDGNGVVRQEVVRVETGVPATAELFELPRQLRIVTLDQILRQPPK